MKNIIGFPHSLLIDELLKKLESSVSGLNNEEVQKRLFFYGENILKHKKPKNIALIFFEQFLDPIIYLLGGAMALAFIFEEWLEGFAVLIVILITTLIGFFMEWQAIRSVESLQKITQTVARVLRNGLIENIKARFLVPGDIILLEAGDVVPADARIIESHSLAVKEAVLTGESDQIEKNTIQLPEHIGLPEQKNMVFNGTIVSRGSGKAVVTSTGDDTVIGQITSLTQRTEKERPPLEHKLAHLSHKLIWLTLSLSVVIAITGYIQGKDLMLMIKTAIALSVAAIPEGLPIVATIALAQGMVNLSKQKIIIKKLEAVQTLGETGVICTDKTGTLTENKMAVHTLLFDEKVINEPDVRLLEELQNNESLNKILNVSILCNNCEPNNNKANEDAIELALLEFALKSKTDIKALKNSFLRIGEVPFDAEIKRMATLHEHQEKYFVFAKGAVESILDTCNFILTCRGIEEFTNKDYWIEQVNGIAAQGLRVLAFAYSENNEIPLPQDYFKNLIFLGIAGFMDPPREDVKDAIEIYKNAGIKVVMITGDHPQTAKKIGEEIGLLKPGEDVEKIIHGKDILNLDNIQEKDEKKILNATVFARMIPKQKLDLVNLFQKHNNIVGMLGDGVNDAPALKTADVGIAMGIRGTEAAKEVADVILMDDKFTSTELAIRQGRNIFGNIRKFVVFLLSCNLAEIISVAIASITLLPLPLLPLQILFLNLITDVFPALALGMGKGEKHVMKQPPRDPAEPIMTSLLWRSTLIFSLSITAGVIGISLFGFYWRGFPQDEINNMAFYTLILAQLLNIFNLPKRDRSFFVNEVTKNKWVWGSLILSISIVIVAYNIPLFKEVLSLVPLSWEQYVTIGIFSIATLLISQIIKRLGGTF